MDRIRSGKRWDSLHYQRGSTWRQKKQELVLILQTNYLNYTQKQKTKIIHWQKRKSINSYIMFKDLLQSTPLEMCKDNTSVYNKVDQVFPSFSAILIFFKILLHHCHLNMQLSSRERQRKFEWVEDQATEGWTQRVAYKKTV